MKLVIGDKIKIKNKNDINTSTDNSPGWDYDMEKFCGKEFQIEQISKSKNDKPLWVLLKHIPFYVWHVDWLIDMKTLPPVFCIAKHRYSKNTGKIDKCEYLQEGLSQNKCIKHNIIFSNYASKTCRNWRTLEKDKREKIDYLPEDLFEI